MLKIFTPNGTQPTNIKFLGTQPADRQKLQALQALQMAECAQKALAKLNARLALRASQQAIADQQQAEYRMRRATQPADYRVTSMSMAFAAMKQVVVPESKPEKDVFAIDAIPTRNEGGLAALLRSAHRNGYTHYRLNAKTLRIPAKYRS